MDAYFNAAKFSSGCITSRFWETIAIFSAVAICFMTFAGSLSMSFDGFKSLKRYPWAIVITIAFLHILMPIVAYFVQQQSFMITC